MVDLLKRIAPLSLGLAAIFNLAATAGVQLLPPTNATPVVANSPLNGFYAAANTSVNECPALTAILGCAAGSTIVTQTLTLATSSGNPVTQESGATFAMFANTGYVAMWAGTTGYTALTYILNGTNIYIETVASCTSAGSGGPTGTGSGITDGSCSWNYAAPSYANAKQAIGFNIITNPGGGHTWGVAGANQIESGWLGGFAAGIESDLSNYSSVDPTVGGANTIWNMYLSGPTGMKPITSELYISPQSNGANFGAHTGILLNGSNAFKDAVIEDISTGSGDGYFSSGTYTTAWMNESAIAPVGILLGGTHTTAALFIVGGSHNAIQLSDGEFIVNKNGVGYAAGIGGAVTQITSRTTGVTINKPTGQITLFTAAGSATPATFSVTDSAVSATDTIVVNVSSATNLYETFVTGVVGGAFNVTFFTTGGTTSDAPVINFSILKGAAS